MKKLVCLLFAVAFSGVFAGEKCFADLRPQIKRVKHCSEEDFALGDKLLARIRKQAASRKRVWPKTRLIMETVTHRAGRLWMTNKYWRNRQLFADRKYWEPQSQFSLSGLNKTFELMEMYGIEGNNYFLNNSFRTIYYDAMEKYKRDPAKLKIIPTMTPAGFAIERHIIAGLPKHEYIKRAVNSPYTMTFNGKVLILGYSSERCTPEQINAFVLLLEKIGGKKIAYISDQAGSGPKVWMGSYWAERKQVPATDLLKAYDHLTAVLKYAAGVEYGYYCGNSRRVLDREYYEQVLLPLIGAACARGDYNGKRIFALKTIQGYTNCNGSQTVSSDGTKTIRQFFELADKFKIDLLCGFEWDELNESTNLEPTVAKPFANQRIIRYCMDRIKGAAPRPNPGDDLTVPNLIVSTNRQLSMGQEFELELLNVPDGSKEKYTVSAELFDNEGNVLCRIPEMVFDSTLLKDKTIVIPTEKFTHSMYIQPRVTVKYKGKTQVYEGLPPTVLRGTVNIDHTWFSIPLRNLLVPEKAEVAFVNGKKIRPGALEVEAKVNVKFKEELNALEIINNSQDVFSYDKFDEFGFKNEKRKLYRLSFRYIIPMDVKKNRNLAVSCKVESPKAWRFNTYYENKPAYPRPVGDVFKVHPGRNCHNEMISIPAANAAAGTLTVSGIRLAGPAKGKKFTHTFKFSDTEKAGVSSVVFDDGFMLALETAPKTPRLPLGLDLKEVSFNHRFPMELPDGVLAVRAVSNSGKVWYSAGYTPVKVSGKMISCAMVSDRRGTVRFKQPASRVPDFTYDFNAPEAGYIIPAPAGRDYYAHAGSFVSIGTGFEGIIHGCTIPWTYERSGTAPRWIKVDGGRRALKFDGKTTQALMLPNTFVPQRHSFTVTMEIKPDDVRRQQTLLDGRGPASYLHGYMVSVKNGKLILNVRHRQPWKRFCKIDHVFNTDVPLYAGKKQRVSLSFDGRFITVAANGKKQRFDLPGITYWLTISAFGGRENNRFGGVLYSISTKHFADK